MGKSSVLSAVACLLALSGCGAATLNDDDQADAGADAEVEDTEAPFIVSSDPDEGGISVSVLDSMHVTFNEPLDPATVNEITVQVGTSNFFYGGVHVAGTVSYDAATYTITFDPDLPLLHESNFFGFDVVIGAVTDVAGNAFAGDLRPFFVYRNSAVREVQYNAATGVPTSYRRYTLDAEGRQNLQNDISGPGGDTVWFTADDVITNRSDIEYDDAGRPAASWSYGDPGTDGDWNTDDDTIDQLVTLSYNADGKPTTFAFHAGPGTDGDWNTTDDDITQYIGFVHTLQNMTRQAVFIDPGMDLEWFTSDDIPNGYAAFEYNAASLQTRVISYQDEGADFEWFTADDTIDTYEDSEYDDENRMTRHIRYGDPGMDNEWLNGDDVPSSWQEYQYDDTGLILYVNHIGPGLDGDWLTTDDDIGSYTTYSNNDTAQPLDIVYFNGAGVDGDWFTTDDNGYRHDGFAYDANLQQTTSYDYSPGVDAKYGTPDDVISSYQGTTYDARGNRIRYRNYSDFGIDGDWETSDDRFGYGEDYNTEL